MVGVGVVAALLWLGVTLTAVRSELRSFKAENQEAHAGITKNVDGVKQDVRDVREDVRMLTSHLLNRAVPPDA